MMPVRQARGELRNPLYWRSSRSKLTAPIQYVLYGSLLSPPKMITVIVVPSSSLCPHLAFMDPAKPKQMGKPKESVKELRKQKVRRSGTRKSSVRSSRSPAKGWVLW
jgi:hypothetical protein